MDSSRVFFRVFYKNVPHDISFKLGDKLGQLKIFILCVSRKLATASIKQMNHNSDRLNQTFKDNDAKGGKMYSIDLGNIADDKLFYSWLGPWDEYVEEKAKCVTPVQLEEDDILAIEKLFFETIA